MISYYLRHFCSIQMAQSLKINDKNFDKLKLRKSVRPCINDMYSECPSSYSNDEVSNKCTGYQSVVLDES